MGYKGTIRSFSATLNRMERDARRKQREYEKREKELAKLEEIEQALYEVERYENYIDLLQTIHHEVGKYCDWNEIKNQPLPLNPTRKNTYKNKAQNQLNEYKPGLFAKLFNTAEKKIKSLKSDIDKGVKRDELEFEEALNNYKCRLGQREEDIELANAVLNFEDGIYEEVIEGLDPFGEINNIGSKLDFKVLSKNFLEAFLHVNGEEIVPKQKKTQLQSGKLSVKNMPRGQFYEIYQDYVCSCVLRIANEAFHLLPIDTVCITASSEMLDTQTGHLEEAPILSVLIHRETLEKLDLNYIDPSDSMDNFVYNMDFKKTKGFQKVDRIDSQKYL